MGRGRSGLAGWGWGLKGRSEAGAGGGHRAASLLILRAFVSPSALNLQTLAVSLLFLSISISLLFASVSLPPSLGLSR